MRLTRVLGVAAVLGAVGVAMAQESGNPQHVPLGVDIPNIETMRVVLNGRNGGYSQRDNCPVVSSLTSSSFTGGTYTAQGGFAQQEIAAATYTLPAAMFPLKITLMEFIIAQQNATVTTTTQWSVLVWDGIPTNGTLVADYSSDGTILPHIVMGPGTRGTNVQVSVDANDPEQIYIFNPNNDPTHSFTIGFRIDVHNEQTQNPCNVAPPSARNAFPCTDNTVIGCGSGYAALNYPSDNWLFAVNCGPNGCPPNGGWTRFSGLQTDSSIFGICITGCRPRGDWVMRATWDPVNCPPPEGACCFGTSGCFITNQTACQQAGGTYKGPGSVCGTPSGGQFPGCLAPPNNPPVAVAGDDQVVVDSDGSGEETIVVDGSASYDNDPGDYVANYRWSEGATVLQDGPAFLSVSLPVGVHTLTLRATDSLGASHTDTVVVDIQPGGPGCDPDYDQNGVADQDDIAYLINVIGGGENPTGRDPDFDCNGVGDQDDVAALINTVAGSACPC